MKPIKTWIVVANATKARIIENKGPDKGLHQLEGKTFEASEPNEYADQEGRSFNSGSSGRHKLETPQGIVEADREYIKTIISSLSEAYTNKQFDRLVVCAEPRTLGSIRQFMSNQLKQSLIAELSKDLVHVSTDDLPKYFQEVLAV